MAIHGYTVNDDGTMEKTFSGSVSVFFLFFLEKEQFDARATPGVGLGHSLSG